MNLAASSCEIISQIQRQWNNTAQSCWWGGVCLFSALWGLSRGFSSTMHTRFMAEISGKADLIRLWLGSKAWDHTLEQMTWINSCRRGFDGIIFSVQLKKKKEDFFRYKINGNFYFLKMSIHLEKYEKIQGCYCSSVFSETLTQLLHSPGPHGGVGHPSCTQWQSPLLLAIHLCRQQVVHFVPFCAWFRKTGFPIFLC